MRLRRNLLINISLTALAILYYLPFINKGLILFDEGYMLHLAERISQGEIPYYDFFIQYTPGFFYLLALCFKLFGANVFTGRIFTVAIAVVIIFFTLFLLDEMKLNSVYLKIFTFAILISFGFPLFNIPIVVWPCILLTILIMYAYTRWSNSSFTKLQYSLYIGFFLSILFFIKQNLGLTYLILLTIIIFFSDFKKRKVKIYSLIVMNSVFLFLSAPWIYYFFLRNGFLYSFLAFNRLFFILYPLSYPPLTYLFQASGLFKLLPYYLPILFLLLLCHSYILKRCKKDFIFVSLLPLAGFAVTVIPASDLLHVYPFLGLALVMFMVFLIATKGRFHILYLSLIVLTVISGFYLTFFREQYRYGLPYRLSTVPLNLSKAQNIFIDATSAKEYVKLNKYIVDHTKRGDYIFVYPFAPMLYFIFDHPNPSAYANTLPGYLTVEEEMRTIENIKKKKVFFIVTAGEYKYKTSLSKWIQTHTTLALGSSIGVQIFKVIDK